MSFQLDTASISHQLVVGQNYPIALGLGEKLIRGSSYIESPSVFGDPILFPLISASTMIGPVINTDSPTPFIPGALCGKNYSPYSLSVVGDAAIFDNLSVNGEIDVGQHLIAQGEVISRFGGGQHILSLKKNFDIPHPSKPNHRLRYTCPEAPYNDVYIRGKLLNNNKIMLPEYWVDFVDYSTITVQLQPIGKFQKLSVKKIKNNTIIIKSNNKNINCYYHIFAERNDGEKLIPEYMGNTPNDYPGDNSQYSVVGWNYDERK